MAESYTDSGRSKEFEECVVQSQLCTFAVVSIIGFPVEDWVQCSTLVPNMFEFESQLSKSTLLVGSLK